VSVAHPETESAVSARLREPEKYSIPIESGPAQFNLILSAPLRPVCYCSEEICGRSATDRILDVIGTWTGVAQYPAPRFSLSTPISCAIIKAVSRATYFNSRTHKDENGHDYFPDSFVCGLGVAIALATASTALASSIGAALFDSSTGSVNSEECVACTGPLYASFSTSSSAFSLTDVELGLTNFGNSDAGTFTVGLYENISPSPICASVNGAGECVASNQVVSVADAVGPLLDTLGTVDVTTLSAAENGALYDFDFASIGLTPDTRYWIELSSTASNDAGWERVTFTSDTAGFGVAGEYHADTLVAAIGPNLNGTNGSTYEMLISGTETSAIPEPGTVALLSVGLAGLGCAMRRRRFLIP